MSLLSLRNICFVLSAVFVPVFLNPAHAQTGYCPPNMDFEYGDFSFWECATGTVGISSGKNTITWTGTGQATGQHTIIPSVGSGNDLYGGFPQICPNGSGYSVKLGNNSSGRGAEKISYTYSIPSTLNVFSMIFHYAVVLQNPNHSVEDQPRFRAKIIDLSTNEPLPCATFDFAASGGLPGFRVSQVDLTVIYKEWTPITVNLNAYIGRTIQLEFTTSDCTLGGHFGYAYIDVNSNCNGAISGTTLCQGDNSLSLTAPYGFQSYEWYSDNTFSTLLATTQVLPLNPAPAIGTVYPVIVKPFAGYGCVDTLYATITVSPKPVSFAGNDTSICKFQNVPLGRPPTSGQTYAWTPANLVSNPIISDPIAYWNGTAPTEFIVKTTDILTGCFSYDTTIVSGIIIDTAIRLTGNATFCIGRNDAVLSVNNTAATIQWYNNSTPVPAATSVIYRPSVSGNYWAQLTERGCTDTTASFVINISPLPRASFTVNEDTLCVTNNNFVFTNTSTVSDNSPLSHNWSFSDGSTVITTDATKNFPVVGTYQVKLVTATTIGCKDSVNSTVYVLPNGVPDFLWDTICINRPVLFRNISRENGSALVRYNWTFNNGGPGFPIKNPPPINYTTAGLVDVILQMTTLGCETDPKTVTKKINVNAPLPGYRYKDITVPLDHIWPLQIRDTVGSIYVWRPQVQLTNYNTPRPDFIASGNDILYRIDITNKNTCITTDTLFMQVLKKPGYYIPTGFTPNGDGLNDDIKPYLVAMKSLKSFTIFNRWGNRVFHTEKYGEGWNGKYLGIDQQTGSFAWVMQYYDLDNKLLSAKGIFTLMR